MPKTDRPTRAQGRLITGLLATGRTDPDGWLRDEREAVTRLHTWAHGAPPRDGARARIIVPEGVRLMDPTAGPVEVEYRHEGQVLIGGHDPEGCDANLDALRAEVARLTGLLDEAGTRYEGMRERRNRAREHAVTAERERDLLGGEVEDERRRAEQAEAERDEARQAAAEARRDRDDARAQVVAAQQQIATDGEQLDRTARHREALADEVRELRARALTAEDEVRALREQRDGTEATLALYRQRGALHPPTELSVNGPGTVTCDGGRLAVVYEPAVAAEAILADHEREHPDLDEGPQLDRPTRVAGIDGDPRRPSRDHYDEVGVTLSWRELRSLVALHLDHADTSPARPHLLARAMREDGAPLRLAEVLDR